MNHGFLFGTFVKGLVFASRWNLPAAGKDSRWRTGFVEGGMILADVRRRSLDYWNGYAVRRDKAIKLRNSTILSKCSGKGWHGTARDDRGIVWIHQVEWQF